MLRIAANIRAKLKEKPLVILFDSLRGDRTYELSLVRKLIGDEWGLKEAHRFSNRNITADSIPVLIPSQQPQQPNGYDCGLYALTNIEKMLSW